MKRLLLGWCALWCALLIGSCKYDDAELWASVDDLSGRVAALENASRQAQSDIAALQTLAQKMYERVSVASVLTNEDGSYTIAFTDGAKVTISNGTDGITPPSLSVTEVDGVCYWVLVAADGTQSFLLDKAGQRVQANGREGRSPQVRINADSGEWEISTDEGATWTSTGVKARGEDGDAYFTDVRIEGGYVVFTLAAGGELRLLRELDLKIVFVVEGEQEFSFGERRVLPMEISGAERFSISKPDGWRAQLTGEGLAVTAPAEENVWAEIEGTISVVGFASTGQGAVAEIAVSAGLAMPDTYENLSAGGTANCYVVGAAGGYSLDATVMGNGAAGATFGGVTFADFKATLAPVSARVVWMTEKSLVRSLSIENGRLKFVVPEPFRAGNALIAACDAEGGILWSWHIWLTDADLGASLQTYGDGFVLMDRNLGALAGRPTGEADVETFGLYYQWGRKDPVWSGPTRSIRRRLRSRQPTPAARSCSTVRVTRSTRSTISRSPLRPATAPSVRWPMPRRIPRPSSRGRTPPTGTTVPVPRPMTATMRCGAIPTEHGARTCWRFAGRRRCRARHNICAARRSSRDVTERANSSPIPTIRPIPNRGSTPMPRP